MAHGIAWTVHCIAVLVVLRSGVVAMCAVILVHGVVGKRVQGRVQGTAGTKCAY